MQTLFYNEREVYMSNNKLHTIIFSKDRALQLDSLLRSIKDHYSEMPLSITVLYSVSDESYNAAYQKLQNKEIISGIKWHKESFFSDDMRGVINALEPSSNIQFLVDDDVIFRPFNLSILSNFSQKYLAISLRVDKTYPRFSPPSFLYDDKYLEWNWYPLFKKRTGNFWYYPFSVDGNIFHTSDIQKMLTYIKFKAPNSFEGEMSGAKKKFLNKRIMLGTPKAVLFNNPLNSVQQEGETWNEGLSVGKMNSEYLDGYVIDNSVLYRSNPDEVHYAVKLLLTGK